MHVHVLQIEKLIISTISIIMYGSKNEKKNETPTYSSLHHKMGL